MKNLMRTLGLSIAVISMTALSVQAAPTAESEMRKLIDTIAPMRVFSVDVNISLAGSYFDKKPNFPRNGNLNLTIDSPSKDKSSAGVKLSLTTVKGPMTFGLASLGQKLYLTLMTPSGKDGYFFDREKSEMKREKQMINGVLGSVQGTVAMTEKDPGNSAVKKIDSKATLTLPVPGMLKIVDKKNDKKVVTIKYDKTSYMPQIVNFRDDKEGIRGSLHFRNWKLNQNVKVTLPLPLPQYRAFEKNSLGTIVQSLPSPQEVLSPEPMTVSMVKPGASGASMPSHTATNLVKPSGETMPPAMQRELKQTVTELKNVVEVLKDPKFQRSLNKAASLLKRLEQQLDRMEKLQK